MANIFKNPLVIAENIVGSVVDQRSVVLYEQDSFKDSKKELIAELKKLADGTKLSPTVEDYVKKQTLVELFTGGKVKYLSDINGFNVWGISYQDASVSIESDICDHPIETGQVITDVSILNPISAELNIVMPTAFYTVIFEEVKKYYEEKKKIIMLTKFGVYRDMIISAMPYKLDNGTVDRPVIALKLRQIMEVEPVYETMDITDTGFNENTVGVIDDSNTEILNQKRYSTALGDAARELMEAQNV